MKKQLSQFVKNRKLLAICKYCILEHIIWKLRTIVSLKYIEFSYSIIKYNF